MATLPITELENHPDGTVGAAAIVNSNWERMEDIFDPALSVSDTAYHAFWKALVRDATTPTAAGSMLGWNLTTGRMHFHPGYAEATYAAAFTPDVELGLIQKIELTGTINFQSISNQAAGDRVRFELFTNGSTRNMTFPAGWRWIGNTKPASIAANKIGVMELTAHGVTDADVVAIWVVEA